MADGDESSDNPHNNHTNGINNDNNESGENIRPLRLDLGDDMVHTTTNTTTTTISESTMDLNRLGNHSSPSGVNENHRRDDNPFSFKHFLRSDSLNYQNKGARPKVYCEGRPVSSNLPSSSEPKSRLGPEYSSALPDFVQDHLVVEQCYLGSNNSTSSGSNFNLDINLPDFTPSRCNNGRIPSNSSHRDNNNDLSVPLDLPTRPTSNFPLDLPIGTSPGNVRVNSNNSEVGVSKSLPDFLADGAVHSQNTEAASPEKECDRLQRELDLTRQHLIEQTRRADNLSRELEIARNKEHDYTQNLAKALEQVEENLEKSNMRTSSAESTIFKLKQEIKILVNEINQLKLENRSLRGEEAAGGSHYHTTNEIQSQRLAQELRAAASTAEHSLRQLLTGVDNLRIMAASLENMHRIEGHSDSSFLDLDEATGPAL